MYQIKSHSTLSFFITVTNLRIIIQIHHFITEKFYPSLKHAYVHNHHWQKNYLPTVLSFLFNYYIVEQVYQRYEESYIVLINVTLYSYQEFSSFDFFFLFANFFLQILVSDLHVLHPLTMKRKLYGHSTLHWIDDKNWRNENSFIWIPMIFLFCFRASKKIGVIF